MCVCVRVCARSGGLGEQAENPFFNSSFRDVSTSSLFVRRCQKQGSCTATCLPVHSHSGYHPHLSQLDLKKKKKKKKQLRVRVVSWLGFGRWWCQKLSEQENGSTSSGPKATSDPLDCISAKRDSLLCSCVFMSPLTATTGAAVVPPGKL